MALAGKLLYSWEPCPGTASAAGSMRIGGAHMSNDIVGQGLELMLFGMGTVVVFLALLVVITTTMSRFIGRYFPEPVAPVPVRPAAPTQAANGGAPSDEVVAVISAAVRQHRQRSS